MLLVCLCLLLPRTCCGTSCSSRSSWAAAASALLPPLLLNGQALRLVATCASLMACVRSCIQAGCGLSRSSCDHCNCLGSYTCVCEF
jgi:hypothetical protein